MKGHRSDWDSTVSLDQLGTCMIHLGFSNAQGKRPWEHAYMRGMYPASNPGETG